MPPTAATSSAAVIDALFRKQPAARVGLQDSPWGDTVKKWVGQGMPSQDDGSAVDLVDHFGFDMANCGGWFAWTAKLGEEIVEETDAWKIVRNGNGALLKWWKHKSGTPQHVDFLMTDRVVWERNYRPRLVEFNRERVGNLENMREQLEQRRAAGTWTFFGTLFIWEILRASLGDVNMFVAFAEDPEWIHDFNRVYTDLFKQCYSIYLEEVGRPDGIWIYEDLGYRDRLFISPGMLEDMIFPYYTEIVSFLHEYDLPVVLHSCGYQETMLPLAVRAGFDGINPMEAKAGNDLLKFAEQFGDDLCFIGGLDARVLESGDRDLIRREVGRLIDGMKARDARYVYGSDHSLSTRIDYDDFLFSLDVYREHMLY